MSDKLALRARGKLRVTNWLPLLAVFLALSLTLSIFPSALHPSVVAGPGHQPALQQQANQGREGVADVGVGAGSSVNPTGSIGGPATSGGGQGRGPGSGPGGIAPASLEVGPTPVGAPPPTLGGGGGGGACAGSGCGSSCPPGQNRVNGQCQCPAGYHLLGQQCVKDPVTCTTPGGGSGCPRIPFCYSNSLGPDSQTTEDPLSPPCVSWDSSLPPASTTRGVRSHDDSQCPDCIVVVLLGANEAIDYNTGPNLPGSFPTNADTDRTWRVLRLFFQSHYQTFGRTVHLVPYDPLKHGNKAGRALADDVANLQPPPFAVLPYGLDGYSVPPNPYFAQNHIEVLDTLTDLVGLAGNVRHYSNDFLDTQTVVDGVPYFWSADPSIEDIRDSAVAWVCNSLRGRNAAGSHDFALRTRTRQFALAYDNNFWETNGPTPGTSWLEDFKARTQGCGAAMNGPIQYEDPGNAMFGADPGVARNALLRMQMERDTSLLCWFCGRRSGDSSTDSFATAENSQCFFPEFLFVSGLVADPYGARYMGTGYGAVSSSTPTPTSTCANDSAASGATTLANFDRAAGIRDTWDLPSYTQTYWFRAYDATVSGTVISQRTGWHVYESLMQLYAAIQLAGPYLRPATVAFGSGGPQVYPGLAGWQRPFVLTSIGAATSPAAGYTPHHHAFLKGMFEERWNASGVPPGGPYSQVGVPDAGCYGVINAAFRYSAVAAPAEALTEWPSADDSQAPTAPCTADDVGDLTP